MPIARIRTLDPEAISFLAAKLAARGYQLQFAAPNEEHLEEADLEIIVTRMDSATALQQAQIQAEEMDADVTVYPGALSLPVTNDDSDPVETTVQPVSAAVPEHIPPTRTPWTTPYHADVLQESEEPAFSMPAPVSSSETDEQHSHVMRDAAGLVAANVKHGATILGNFAHSLESRVADWRRRSQVAREERRVQQAAIETSQAKVPDQKLRLVTPPPRRMTSRDRQYRRAAFVAAGVLGVVALGWGLFGRGGPAHPITNSNLANVQQQTPFGAASVSAPVQPAPVSLKPATKPLATSHSVTVRKPTPKPAATRHTRTRVRRHVARSDDGEVVIRHFGSKPVSQQAKAKSRDGVKVITEE